MVLGNTFHLFIQPGHELIAELGGLHEFMGWDGAIVTDSGGYQVFSMGHGSVAEEIKRRRGERKSMIVSIEEEGVRFRSYLAGEERFMGPETSMEIQAALGSDIALVFDECTPVPRGPRLHGELDGAHPPLARPLPGLARRARAGRPAGVRHRAGRRVRGPARRVRRVRERRRRGRDRDRRLAGPVEGADARGGGVVAARARRRAAAAPARHRRRGRPDPRRRRPASTCSTAPRPPGWLATARRSCTIPRGAGGSTSRRARTAPAASRSPRAAAAPPAATTPAPTCTTCCAPASPPPARLLTLHNLTFMEELMRGNAGGDRGRPATPTTPPSLSASAPR